MKFDFDFDHARNEHLAFGQPHLFEYSEFMGVAGIGRFQRQHGGPGVQHDVDDVGQGNVAVMGPFVIAPAQVHPHPLGGDVFDRAVQRLDMLGGALAKFGEFETRPHVRPR